MKTKLLIALAIFIAVFTISIRLIFQSTSGEFVETILKKEKKDLETFHEKKKDLQ